MIPTALAAGRSTAPLPRRGTGDGENTTTATPQPSGTCSITSSDSWLNRPGMSGDSTSWEGWSHVRWFVEEVSAGAA